MAQAVLPAVLQDLINEHKLFQRPEWQRLTQLEKELIDTLSRTDMSAGERARRYASLTYPYRAIRNDVLINGTKLHVNHLQPALQIKKHEIVPSEQDSSDGEEQQSVDDADGVSETGSDISSIVSKHSGLVESVFDSDVDDDEPLMFTDAVAEFSNRNTPKNSAKSSTRLERNDPNKDFIERIIQLFGDERLSIKANTNSSNYLENVSKLAHDLVQVSKQPEAADEKQHKNAGEMKGAIHVLAPELFRDIDTAFPHFAHIRETNKLVELTKKPKMLTTEIANRYIIDSEEMDKMLRPNIKTPPSKMKAIDAAIVKNIQHFQDASDIHKPSTSRASSIIQPQHKPNATQTVTTRITNADIPRPTKTITRSYRPIRKPSVVVNYERDEDYQPTRTRKRVAASQVDSAVAQRKSARKNPTEAKQKQQHHVEKS